MNRTARLSCAALAFAALAGCASKHVARNDSWQYRPVTPAGNFQYRPGTGVIQAVAPAPKPLVSVAGGSAAPAANPAPDMLYRLTIRMDDGRVQYIDTSDAGFSPGTRVRLTDQRLIEKQ